MNLDALLGEPSTTSKRICKVGEWRLALPGEYREALDDKLSSPSYTTNAKWRWLVCDVGVGFARSTFERHMRGECGCES